MEPPPRLWIRFGDFLQLTPEESRRWWTALVRSRWSRARELRQRFLLVEACPGIDREHFAHTATSPGNLVTVLEELTQERMLSRKQSNDLEEAILSKITHAVRKEGYAESTSTSGR